MLDITRFKVTTYIETLLRTDILTYRLRCQVSPFGLLLIPFTLSTGLPGVPGIVKDGRDGSPGDPGEPGEAGRVGRTGHQGPPGICDTTPCQGASAAGKSSNPKNH